MKLLLANCEAFPRWYQTGVESGGVYVRWLTRRMMCREQVAAGLPSDPDCERLCSAACPQTGFRRR